MAYVAVLKRPPSTIPRQGWHFNPELKAFEYYIDGVIEICVAKTGRRMPGVLLAARRRYEKRGTDNDLLQLRKAGAGHSDRRADILPQN